VVELNRKAGCHCEEAVADEATIEEVSDRHAAPPLFSDAALSLAG
jgi:hypothetical protein